MDHIDHHLATAVLNFDYNPAVQAALAIGKKVLNKYYALTDHSELYRIAMGTYIVHNIFYANMLFFLVLHPSHKLEYFKTAGWDEEWCTTAEEIVHTEFERAYTDMEVKESEDSHPVSHYYIQSYSFSYRPFRMQTKPQPITYLTPFRPSQPPRRQQ